MRAFNIHFAKTHLSRLVDEVEKRGAFIIAKAGKPKVMVVGMDAPRGRDKRRLGGLEDLYSVPKNFKSRPVREIAGLFRGRKKR